MTEKEIQELALKYYHGQATPEEEVILHKWYENLGDDNEVVVNEEFDVLKDRLYSRLQAEMREDNDSVQLIGLTKRKWLYYAASVFLFFSFSVFYFYFNEAPISKTHFTTILNNDIGPGGNNAILEFADGTKVNLDEANLGKLANMSGLIINKVKDGILEVEIESSKENINEINTIHTPRGGEYRVKLPDGTLVWLNASSTIKFPSVFGEKIREVELEGEAYFEVAKLQNKRKVNVPFYVKSKGQKIEVLGTRFNISSYPDEQTVKTTLLEGSVRILVDQSKEAFLLKPGQQGKMLNGEMLIGLADIDSEMAWKNGDFIFNNEPLSSIMKKIERWYDIEVVYQNKLIDREFTGAVSRSKNLSAVLQIMELTGKVTFKIDGRRVVIMN